MTEEEKRQQRAALLLQYEETREELQYLRNKAWNLSEDIGEISHWLREAREALATAHEREREQARDKNIQENVSHYRLAFDFDALLALREDLRRANDKLRELAKQKNDLGLGA
ncbi:MAG: hypothetical protein WCC92_12520 [Candidatus Korobacteraceae bacterium]